MIYVMGQNGKKRGVSQFPFLLESLPTISVTAPNKTNTTTIFFTGAVNPFFNIQLIIAVISEIISPNVKPPHIAFLPIPNEIIKQIMAAICT